MPSKAQAEPHGQGSVCECTPQKPLKHITSHHAPRAGLGCQSLPRCHEPEDRLVQLGGLGLT